jgi:SAM-dependent methyltransferase
MAAAAETGIKHYVAAAHAARAPGGRILDVGCGAGHDLELLTRFGLRPVGVDPSAVVLAKAATRCHGLAVRIVRACGEQLPFRAGAFDGVRIERVLLHVDEPSVVLAEVVRCVKPGGLVTVFEPDWSSFTVCGDDLPLASWISTARNPDVGGRLWELLESVGCRVVDRLEELSVWDRLETPERITNLSTSVARAIDTGRVPAAEGNAWLQRQRARDAAGLFSATMTKTLIVATTP